MEFETTAPLDATTLTPTRPERLALRVLQLGAIAVVLAAATWRGFDLDRFLVPKELVLHEHAARRDPSLDAGAPGMTHNPWPSSDWIAFVSERGFAAAALLLFVFATIAAGAFARIRRAAHTDEALLATALLATIAGAGAAGTFDAVLLLGTPALLVWSAVGALMPRAAEPSRGATFVALLLVVVSGAGAARSTAQLVAMELFTRGSRESLVQAARIDPGNFRTHVRLARIGRRAQRCQHANAAHALFPSSKAVRPCH